jgi:hypothetical protein
MMRLKYSVLTTALCLTGLPAQADELGGARWTRPPALTASDDYTMACLDACRTYRVGAAGAFPVIMVHHPKLQNADVAVQWQALRAAEQNETLEEVTRQENEIGAGTVLTRIYKGTGRTTGLDTYYMLSLWQAPGVTVPIETMSMNRDDLIASATAHLELASTISVDLAAMKAADQAARTLLASRATAVDEGYARGETARIFSAITLQTVYGNSVTPIADGTSISTVMSPTQSSIEVEHIVVLLPGGVLLTERPDNPRRPDLAGAGGRKTVGVWREDAQAVYVTWPDGRNAALRKTGKTAIGDADMSYFASVF